MKDRFAPAEERVIRDVMARWRAGEALRPKEYKLLALLFVLREVERRKAQDPGPDAP